MASLVKRMNGVPQGVRGIEALVGVDVANPQIRGMAEEVVKGVAEDRAAGLSREACRRSLSARHRLIHFDTVFEQAWPAEQPKPTLLKRSSQTEQQTPTVAAEAAPEPAPEATPDKLDKFKWADAFCDAGRDALPSTTKLVLWTIWKFMNKDGGSAYPGQETIAKKASLRLPAVKAHVALAIRRGWLKRTKTHRSRYGLGFEYTARIPEGASSVQGTNGSGNPQEE